MNMTTAGPAIASNHNFTDNTLISSCQFITANVDGVAMVASSTGTMTTVDETNYPMDTINVAWSGSVPARIYQIAMRMER